MKVRAGDRERAGAGRRDLLVHQRSGQRHDRDDHEEAADEHGEAERDVVVRITSGGIGGQAGEGAAVVAGGGAVGVEDLAEAVRPGVVESGDWPQSLRRPRR